MSISADKLQEWIAASTASAYEGLYFVGTFDRRITFYSQQVRALRLVQALYQSGRVKSNDRVAIIGAGAAGLTSAVAFALLDCSVTLYDPADDVLQLQSGSPRLLHPHVYEWPAFGSLEGRAGLPFLDWSHGTGGVVTDRLRDDFHSFKSRLNGHLDFQNRSKLNSLHRDGTEWRLGFEGSDKTRVTKHVVLTLGFGEEKTKGVAPVYPYWKPSGVGTNALEATAGANYLVSGNGDGAVTDLLSLLIVQFEHVQFTRTFLGYFDSDQFQRAAIEATRGLAPNADLEPSLLKTLLPIFEERGVLDRLRHLLRTDRLVTANSKGPLFAAGKASLLNQCMLFAVLETAKLHGPAIGRTVGEISDVKGTEGDLEPVGIASGDVALTEHFKHVILRHGPDKAARFSPVASYFDAYRAEAEARLNLTADPPVLDADTYSFFDELRIEKLVDEASRQQLRDRARLEHSTIVIEWDEATHALVQRGTVDLDEVAAKCETLGDAVVIQLEVSPDRLDARNLIRLVAASNVKLSLTIGQHVAHLWSHLLPTATIVNSTASRYQHRTVGDLQFGQAVDASLIRRLDQLLKRVHGNGTCPTIGAVHTDILEAVLGTWSSWRSRLDASPQLRAHFLRWLVSVSRPKAELWQGDGGKLDRMASALVLILATHIGEPLQPAQPACGNLEFQGNGEALGSGAATFDDGGVFDAWNRPEQWDVDALILSGSAEIEVGDPDDTLINAGDVGIGLTGARRVRPAIIRNDRIWRKALQSDIPGWSKAVEDEFQAWRDRQDKGRERVA